MTPTLFMMMHKTSATLAPSLQHQEFLDNHFTDTSTAKWKEFKKKLRSKSFVSAVKQDDRADDKLKRFSASLNRHFTGKGPKFDVPSQNSSRSYVVKYHPDKDSFSCSCGDWTYKQSTKPQVKKQECKHVSMLKHELQARGEVLEKRAAEVRGIVAGRLLELFG